MTKPCIWAVLVAGGTGNRFQSSQSKLLYLLGERAVLAWSFLALQSLKHLSGIVITYHPQWLEDYQKCLAPYITHRSPVWVQGGRTRRESVYHGLNALPQEADVILIHDAARPLVNPERIQAALAPVVSGEALGTSLGLPVQNTLKQVQPGPRPWVAQTIDRSQVWQVHTPQVFRKDILMEAHQQIPKDLPINDDAELVERLYPGQAVVRMVPDDPFNLKITIPEDIRLAEAIRRSREPLADSLHP